MRKEKRSTWRLKGKRRIKTVANELDSVWGEFGNIYIGEFMNHYSPESQNQYMWNCFLFLWSWLRKGDLVITPFNTTHYFSSSRCSCSCSVLLSSFVDWNQNPLYRLNTRVQSTGVSTNLDYQSFLSFTLKCHWMTMIEWIITTYNRLKKWKICEISSTTYPNQSMKTPESFQNNSD